MKMILTMTIAILLSACALDSSTFRDDRFFNSKQVFEKHEQNLHFAP